MQHLLEIIKNNNENTSTTTKKKIMIRAMYLTYSSVSSSCRVAGINRTTHYRWIKKDNNYRKAIHEVNEIRLDESEAMLMKLIAKGNTNAIIFHLTTKGRHRGYYY